MGPPGVGKTAILSQLAEELGAGLVAYTMTHHTRQSAIGLPLIREKTYGGKTCSATEYTMSEIPASIYDQMEQTGQKTGFCSSTRSTASQKRWFLRCCNYCRRRNLENTVSRRGG